MQVRFQAAVTAHTAGSGVNVSAVCRDLGISRKTFYKWAARYRDGGLEGLEARSRRPATSPQTTSLELEDAVVLFRKELRDAGLDHGALSIHSKLIARFAGQAPSTSTVHRILVRRGLVVPSPRKRPKGSWKRFEAAAPNECWQIDATEWATVAGKVEILNVIDDHSRLLVASVAVPTATSESAWDVFSAAAMTWQLPAGVLSDNGLCFSGKIRGFEVFFEAKLRDAGVRPKTSRPYHPQTAGKVERFQQTLKKWLRHQPVAADIAELQAQLARFAEIYNYERPHQGIGRRTPFARWSANPVATASSTPLPHPVYLKTSDHTIVEGKLYLGHRIIHIGNEHTGRDAVVHSDGLHVNVFIDSQLVRHLELDLNRVYQPSGRKRGGPRRRRLPS